MDHVGPRHDSRYGIQQLSPESQTWSSCTIWCGYDLPDAIAEAERSNAAIRVTATAFRVYDRHTGEIMT